MNPSNLGLLKKILTYVLIGLGLWLFFHQTNLNHEIVPQKEASIVLEQENLDKSASSAHQSSVPQYVLTTLFYVRKNHKAPDGYQGGRNFGNYEKLLPDKDSSKRIIRYQERDVHPLRPGKNRGAERLVTSSKDAYYTPDHYQSFIKIE